jgi:predicted dehydrogenase
LYFLSKYNSYINVAKVVIVMKKLSVLLVGAGGYGTKYVNSVFNTGAGQNLFEFTGAILPNWVKPGEALVSSGVPIYETIEEFYKNHRADYAIISTPFFLHREQIETCIANGSHVLCEKPLCTSLYDAMEIKRMAEEGGREVYIGYQLSFSRAVRQLKRDIMSGLFGKPLMMKTIVHYARGDAYYARNNWAGKRYLDDGRLCLDSPLHNAVAHHLNNMLFLLGSAPGSAAYPATVQAELYRANPNITTFDTFALRTKTQSGVDIYFYSSHCLANKAIIGPVSIYRFEKATVFHESAVYHDNYHVAFNDGTSKQYNALLETDQLQKAFDCANSITGGEKEWSGVEAAIPQVICNLGAWLSHPVADIPKSAVVMAGDPDEPWKGGSSGALPKVEGLEELLMDCYDQLKLPSEMENAPGWAVAGRVVALEEIMALKSDKAGDFLK